MIQFTLTTKIPATPETLYATWLNSEGHAAMTGVPASISDRVNDTFSVYSHYIVGRNLELIPNRKIIQTWRTSEFDDADEDSRVEITLTPAGTETILTLQHTNLPEGSPDYAASWEEYYFLPMSVYFSQKG